MNVDKYVCKNFNNIKYAEILSGCDVVIHVAGYSEFTNQYSNKKQYDFNVNFTTKLAQEAVKFGVKRFIFISSAKVNGDKTEYNKKITANSRFCPQSEYAKSKMDAEISLREIEKNKEIEIVIVRPVAVYGPENNGNLSKLVKLVNYKVPLPFRGVIYNKRDFLYIKNLVDFIVLCVSHTKASGRVFMVSDGSPLSTFKLIKYLSIATNKPLRLFKLPYNLLKLFFLLLCKPDFFKSLTKNFEVDISDNYKVLKWKPKYTTKEGILFSFKNAH